MMTNPARNGAVLGLNSVGDTRILPQNAALEQAISDHNLTECLSEIERLGIHRDFAIFLLNHVSVALGGEDE